MLKGEVVVDLSPLKNLNKTAIRRVLTKAIRRAIKVVKDAVKGNAQAVRRFGYLAKSIGVKIKIYDGVAVAIVGPKSKWSKEVGTWTKGKKKGEPKVFRPSFYEHLIEKGTKRTKAKPVLAPALSSTHEQYQADLVELIAQFLSIELSKSKK